MASGETEEYQEAADAINNFSWMRTNAEGFWSKVNAILEEMAEGDGEYDPTFDEILERLGAVRSGGSEGATDEVGALRARLGKVGS